MAVTHTDAAPPTEVSQTPCHVSSGSYSTDEERDMADDKGSEVWRAFRI
jgi:hypothetical protein